MKLVFLPGLAGDATMWRDQLEAFGHLEPAVCDVHTRHDSVPEMAAALLAMFDGPLALCGASMGGILAMEAARQAPERMAGLALLGTTARPESQEMRALRESAIVLFAQGRVAEVIEPNVGMAFHPRHAQDAELAGRYLDFVLRAGAQQLIRQNRAIMTRPDAREHLRSLRAPTLVMCGQEDQLTPVQHSQEIASLVPHTELVVVPQCGHMLTMEQPARVNAELKRWLDRLTADVSGKSR